MQCMHRGGFNQKLVSNKRLEYCSHCKAAESLNPRELFDLESQIGPFHFMHDMTDIQVLRTAKEWLSVVYEKGQYGLIYQNKIGSKTYRCLTCKNSKNCCHVQRWKKYEEVDDDIEIITETLEKSINLDDNEFKAPSSFKALKESQLYTPHPKINFPFTAEQKQQFRKYAVNGYQYDDVLDMKPDACGVCPNNFEWDQRDPEETCCMYSRKVFIHHTEFIEPRQRIVYYRRCLGPCKCIKTFTGEKQLLLNMSKGKIGSVVHLITYSSLNDLLCDWSHGAVSLYGWIEGKNRRLRDQYGLDPIPYYIFQNAIHEYFDHLYFGKESEVFGCPPFGPLPDSVVIDAVSMGIRMEHLTIKNEGRMDISSPHLR